MVRSGLRSSHSLLGHYRLIHPWLPTIPEERSRSAFRPAGLEYFNESCGSFSNALPSGASEDYRWFEVCRVAWQ
jgi:hypothetical protein